MEREIDIFKTNRTLARFCLAAFALTAIGYILNEKFLLVPGRLIAVAVGLSIWGYWHAAARYNCPYCGMCPENKEYVITYGAKVCQECGRELP